MSRPAEKRKTKRPAAAAAALALATAKAPAAKRPRSSPTLSTQDGSSDAAMSFEWIDDVVAVENDREYHDSIRITSKNKSFTVKSGGAVVLSTAEGTRLICRVDRFYVLLDDKSSVKLEGWWFLQNKDVHEKFGGAVTPDSENFVSKLQPDELILTNMLEENDITSIDKSCTVIYLKSDQDVPSSLPTDTYICRFKLDIDTVSRTLEWSHLDMDALSSKSPGMDQNDGNDRTMDGTISSASDDSGSVSGSSVEEVSKTTIHQGEGANLRGEILIGSRYQVKVGPFVPNVTVPSRCPKLIYKANAVSDDAMLAFLDQVADVHVAFLNRQGYTMDEPYTPLTQEKAEAIMREAPGNKPLTGSFLSTASMLSGKRSRLTKECDPDVLLEILAEHNFDTAAALDAIKSNVNRITCGWSRPEKDIFDDGFRRHQNQLRLIAKAINPTKTIQDVVDYHYRFKIPDQFRKYQDKKREHAIRMVECIESKKYHEFVTGTTMNGNETAKSTHWSEKPVSSLVESKDERIRTAKKLLLDVKDIFGRDTMAEVASVIRQLQKAYEPEARDDLFKLLTNQPDLQKRFLEFLPKHF